MPAAHLPTVPGGPTGRLATWIADFTFDQAPPAVQERAKYLILDGIGCAPEAWAQRRTRCLLCACSVPGGVMDSLRW
jgi:2-methylcitrate dehydratase PrpD